MASILCLGEQIADNVCVFIDVDSIGDLRAAHSSFYAQLQYADVQRMFVWQLESRLAARCELPELNNTFAPDEAVSLRKDSLSSLACTVEICSDIISDCVMHRELTEASFEPLRQACQNIRAFTQCDWKGPEETSGTKLLVSRQLMRKLSEACSLVPNIIDIICTFSPAKLPKDIFITANEILASLTHKSEGAKSLFFDSGAFAALMRFVRAHDTGDVKEGGMAMLLALSARSVASIERLAETGAFLFAIEVLHEYALGTELVALATGVLANMSNLPCVCPSLLENDVYAVAEGLLVGSEADASNESKTKAIRFAKFMISNLEDCLENGI